MGINGEQTGKSTVYISEHKFHFRMQSVIWDLHKKTGGNLVTLTDAAFVRLAKMFGVETIGINTSRNPNRYQNGQWENLRLGVCPCIADITGENRRFGKNGTDVISLMYEALLRGKDLFISPTGASSPHAQWLSGIGHLAKKIHQEGLDNKVDFRFVYIPSILGNYRLSDPIPFESIKSGLDLNASGRRVSSGLEELYFKYQNQEN